jgi:hypothetical protein
VLWLRWFYLLVGDELSSFTLEEEDMRAAAAAVEEEEEVNSDMDIFFEKRKREK